MRAASEPSNLPFVFPPPPLDGRGTGERVPPEYRVVGQRRRAPFRHAGGGWGRRLRAVFKLSHREL